MSLPWRFSSVDDYVRGTIEKLKSNETHFSHLKIGKYYQHGDALDNSHIISLFQQAQRNPHVKELSLCGISMNCQSVTALVDLLGSRDDAKRNWKKIILNSCQGPVTMALSMPPDHFIQTISITKCNLTSHDFLSLGMILKFSTTLTTLEITEETLDGERASALAEGIKTAKYLTTFELSYCTFDDEGTSALVEGLRANQHLESLLLSGCELEDTQVAQLFQSLKNHPCLNQVTLFRNHCGATGAMALETLLSTPTDANPLQPSNAISKLDLSYQQFERANKLDISLVASGLAVNSTLMCLSLSFNKLNDNDAETLAKVLSQNTTMRELDLRANNIRDRGVIAMATELVQQSTLRNLFLFGNPFGEEGANALLEAIRHNTNIQVLNMDYNSCSYEEIQYYACLNHAGRKLLKMEQVHPAIWPLVLERAEIVSSRSRGVCSGPDVIYHLLRGPAVLHRRG
jgi:Ran GTPase-activating protein (RanGAP) involved in mRNA processing and transport